MRRRRAIEMRSRERGQTLVLVALFLVVLMGMAALAIDATTLYVARSETQRAADAAALAGAKAFVDSGVTTAPSNANLQSLALDIATQYINATLTQNKVQGVLANLVGAPTPVYPANNPGNPQITVTLQRTNLPTFFARIFGQRLATVTASATAEAYNPSNPAGAAPDGSMPPVAPTCVKPWIVPNADPGHGKAKFVAADGQILNPGVWKGAPDGIIGEPITLTNDCKFLVPGSCSPARNPPVAGGPGHPADGLDYLPVEVAAATGPCPSCAGGTAFEQCSSCCDGSSTRYSCGASAPGVLIDTSTNIISKTITSIDCAIGASGPGGGQGQDSIATGNFLGSQGTDPIEVRGGSSSAHNGRFVSTSPSIMTLPIYDSSASAIAPSGPSLLGPVKIIGYMQVFVEQTNSPDADVVATILNISGCGTNVNTGLTPISGGGVSSVPVRLIHN